MQRVLLMRVHGLDHDTGRRVGACAVQPEDVQRAVQGAVSDATVQRVLAALRTDPVWMVLEPFCSSQECVFQVVYRPTGMPNDT